MRWEGNRESDNVEDRRSSSGGLGGFGTKAGLLAAASYRHERGGGQQSWPRPLRWGFPKHGHQQPDNTDGFKSPMEKTGEMDSSQFSYVFVHPVYVPASIKIKW